MCDDFHFLLTKLKEHPDYQERQTRLLNKKVHEDDAFAFLYDIGAVVSLLKDSHSMIVLKQTNILPLTVKVINSKIYMRPYNTLEAYLELIAINDIKTEQLVKEMSKTFYADTKALLDEGLRFRFNQAEALLSLPALRNSVSFTFLLKNGADLVSYHFDPKQVYRSLDDLTEANGYMTRKYYFKYDESLKLIVVKVQSFKEDINLPIKMFLKALDENIKTKAINKLVIDLRGNTNFDKAVATIFFNYIKTKEAKIVVLVDGLTSGELVTYLKGLVVVGSDIVGTKATIKHYDLPHTNSYLLLATSLIRVYLKATVMVKNSIEDINNHYDRELAMAKKIIDD